MNMERSAMMKGAILLLAFCIGVFCLVLGETMQRKDAQTAAGAPVRRVVICDCCAESENPVSKIISRIKSCFFPEKLIILEEEIEMTRDIPKGTSFENLSNSSLDPSSWADAYGVGSGR